MKVSGKIIRCMEKGNSIDQNKKMMICLFVSKVNGKIINSTVIVL